MQPTSASSSSGATSDVAEVTCIAKAPSGTQLAAGYSNGTVRLWDTATGECTVVLEGHKSAVTALRYHPAGALLASGSKDTDVIVWDVVGEAGLFRLRGHKDQVTDLVFLAKHNKVVSASKDSHLRVWDLEQQHCTQTLVGFRGEVWSLDVNPEGTRLVTGSSDQELRMYEVVDHSAAVAGGVEGGAGGGVQQNGGSAPVVDRHESLRALGSLRRSGQERVSMLRYCGTSGYLACQVAGKTVEMYRVRDREEAVKKMKRRQRRKRAKDSKKEEGTGPAAAAAAAGEEGGERGEDMEDVTKAADELEAGLVVKVKSKIQAFDFHVLTKKLGGGVQLALALSNNSVEIVDVKADGTELAIGGVRQAGHRSDVRVVALSNDDSTLLTASSSGVKVWNPSTGACLGGMDSGYGLSAVFAPGNQHAVLGTKAGTLQVFDLGAATCVQTEAAHTGPVWSLAALPDQTGFVSASADKQIKFWEWQVVVPPGGGRRVGLKHSRTLKMAEDVLAVKISPDGKLLAAALLDSTIKVFHMDSLKFFLALYGHKLPVLSLDISSDSTLLVSASADKNIKIWGLDFGDCHRSLFAHGDAVTQVAFVRNTHYCFTVGKDKAVKYWDCDRFEVLQELAGHHGEVWALALSSYGDFLITGSHDRSIRRWERTSEPFFVEEEREKRLESLFAEDLEDRREGVAEGGKTGEDGAAAPAGRKTLETVTAADSIIDALDMAAHETERQEEHKQQQQAAGPSAKPLPPNPLLLGMAPGAYVLRAVSSVRANDLEHALLMVPFTDALALLKYLPRWLKDGSQVELCCRIAVLLLRLHMPQLTATPSARPVLLQLQQRLRGGVQTLKDVMGFNSAAAAHLMQALRQRTSVDASDSIVLAKRKLAQLEG